MSKGYDKYDFNVDLLLHLSMKEGSGTVTRDWAKPRHKNPTLTGAPSWGQIATTGKNYLDFDSGNPDFVEISAVDSADLDFTTESFTLVAWVKINTFNVRRAIISRSSSLVGGYYIDSDGTHNRIRFVTFQAGTYQITTSLSILDTIWQHIVVTRIGASATIYINGVNRTDEKATHINPISIVQNFRVGLRGNDTEPFDGQIGDVRIYDRALPQDEFKALFESTREDYLI